MGLRPAETGPQRPLKRKESVPKAKEPPIKPSSEKKEPSAEEQNKKTATSLILFEEVTKSHRILEL